MTEDNFEKPELHSRSHPIREHMRLQIMNWRFERCGWVLLLVIVIVSLAGLFSDGPLSSAAVHGDNGESYVNYQCFVRNGAAVTLRVGVAANTEGQIVIKLDGDLLQDFSIENIHPEPIKSVATASGITLTHLGTPNEIAQIHFSLRSQRWGFSTTRITTAAGSVLQINQFIYP